jgi:hypothetical protein
MKHLLPLALLIVPCSSCRVGQPIEADSREAELAAQVKELLDSERDELPRLAIREQFRHRYPDGTYYEDMPVRGYASEEHIGLKPDLGEHYEEVLIHELTHWYVTGSPYDGIPGALEEGLAAWVAWDFTGLLPDGRKELSELGVVLVQWELLYSRWDDGTPLKRPGAGGAAAAGFEVVRRLGLDRVRELQRAGADMDDFLIEAGLIREPGRERWEEQVSRNPDYRGWFPIDFSGALTGNPIEDTPSTDSPAPRR